MVDQNMLDLAISVATVEDAGEIITLQRAAFLRDAQLYNDPFLPSLTQTVADLVNEMGDDRRVVLVGRVGQRIVGSVRAHVVDRTSHIGRLMTAPDLEGAGIASALLVAVEATTAPDADSFQLGTGSSSAANIAMYKRRGYEITGGVERTPQPTEVTMNKPRFNFQKDATGAGPRIRRASEGAV